MLKLIIDTQDAFDDATQEFTSVGGTEIVLEHSLVSLSKWESKFQRPFLTSGKKTDPEVKAYIEAMVISPGVDPEILSRLDAGHYQQINDYIDSSETATTFGEMPERKGRGEIITAELIYYWLIAFQIPFEVQHWHLNKLFALVRVCNVKNSKPKKMNRREVAERNARLNEQRRKELGTSG